MVGRCVLAAPVVERILHRLALQVLERHYGGSVLPAIVPASPRGEPLARQIEAHLLQEASRPCAQAGPGVPILLVDDVLYTGRTLLGHLVRWWEQAPQVEALVLVDRGHRRYPIAPDYVGLALATTLQERVEVRPTEKGWEVWLV